jgi:hypothetical protein
MPQLVKLVEEIEAAAAANTAAMSLSLAGVFLDCLQQQQQQALHTGFRLWLTSSPVGDLPPAVMHRGVRVVLERPRGVKAQLLKAYSSLPPALLASCSACGREVQWQRLLFVASLLHSLLCERRRFGPLGWNVPYEFSDGDLACALFNIQAVVQDVSQDLMLPLQACEQSGSSDSSAWDALEHIVGQVVYGGRVTDPEDRRLLAAIMQQHLAPAALAGAGQQLSTHGECECLGWQGHQGVGRLVKGPPITAAMCTANACAGAGIVLGSPQGSDVAACLAHIQALPLEEGPSLFGLHASAAIACSQREGRLLLEAVVSMQPSVAASPLVMLPAAAGSSSALSDAAGSSEGGLHAPALFELRMGQLVQQLVAELPLELDRAQASILHSPFGVLPCGRMDPLGVVLLQEIARWGRRRVWHAWKQALVSEASLTPGGAVLAGTTRCLPWCGAACCRCRQPVPVWLPWTGRVRPAWQHSQTTRCVSSGPISCW